MSYQYREMSRFNPDGDDMRVSGPTSPPFSRCEYCGEFETIDKMVNSAFCLDCWESETVDPYEYD